MAPTRNGAARPAAKAASKKAAGTSRGKSAPRPPRSTLVLFVRHGQTPSTGSVLPGRAKGLRLSDSGREQATAVAERLRALKKVDALYASPLERTRDTAAPIAKALGLSITVDKGLLECDFGEWTGAKLSDLAKKPEWRVVQWHPSGFRFPGGESFMEMQARICDTVSRLCAAHPGGVVVAVSHAAPVTALVADHVGTPVD